MQRIKLYRPHGNNGVQVVLTEAAYRAFLNSRDGINDMTILRVIAEGTMTFVESARYLTTQERRRYHGTYQMLDELAELFEIVLISGIVFVPFSQGSPDQDLFAEGYGYNAERFDALIAAARQIEEANAAAVMAAERLNSLGV